MEDLNSILSGEGTTPEPVAQVVETPAVEEVQAEATGDDSAAPAPTQEDPIETHRKGLETAVVAERRKRQEAEHRAQALEARIAEFTRQQQPAKAAEGPPDPAQFQENPQEYWRLLARHEARQELQETIRQSNEAQAQQRQQQVQQQAMERVNAVVSAGQVKYRDFDAVINAGLGPFLNQTMRDVIADSDAGADVSYWLAKNPGEAARVSALPERQMVREVTKLEQKLSKAAVPELPQTLTSERNAQGRFIPADNTPSLASILGR